MRRKEGPRPQRGKISVSAAVEVISPASSHGETEGPDKVTQTLVSEPWIVTVLCLNQCPPPILTGEGQPKIGIQERKMLEVRIQGFS